MRPTRTFFAPSSASSTQGRTWPWAVGSIVAVVLVLGAALAGHTIVSHRHAPPLTVAAPSSPPLAVAAPSSPPLAVVAATPPDLSAQLVALDASAGHLVALTAPGEPACPPVGACPPAPPLQRFTVLDSQTGAILATAPLAGGAAQSVLLLADSTRHLAYAVAPRSVDIYSTLTGQRVGGYTLPGSPWQRESGGVFDTATNALILAGDSSVEALDAATGRPLAAWRAPAGTARLDGPVLDDAHGLVYVLAQPETGLPALVVLNAATLASVGAAALPGGSRLGPFDATTHTLYVSGKSGAPCRYTVDATSGIELALGPAPGAGIGCDVSGIGWNMVLGHIYLAGPAGISLRDFNTDRLIAALPLRVAWPAAAPLLVDASRGLLYLPDEHGTILIARDSATPGSTLPAGSAVLLARSAMGRFLPDTNQDPPFVAPESFPATAGTTSLSFWQHYADIGWQGPYAGTTETAVSAAPGQSGSYLVTFSMTWNQLFLHHHAWVCLVAPDGGVLLQSETGDPVP